MHEGGHRVPFIAAWPGVIPPGSTSEETVMTMDFFPTFANLGGVASPEGHHLDGVDMMPFLKGEPNRHDRTLHWLFGDAWAVRKGPWKLVGNGNTACSLVNLEQDIGEKRNQLEEQPERVKKLVKLREDWVEEVGDR